ncbi:M48 family metallopeptidase [Bdellovibrio sp. HCB274]|uniref:M48 family metallopeptidase n=1 Tax=Bdellovibrio sp. HCB274 TaxID=3394361 RepID=UPI0039B4A4DF
MSGSVELFDFANWAVELHRKPFRRSLSIYLYPNRPIKVVTNKITSQQTVLNFLSSKREWIEKNFIKFEAMADLYPKKSIQSGEKFPFLGVDRELKVVVTLAKKAFVSVSEEQLFLHIPKAQWEANTSLEHHPKAIAEIRHFYKREAVKMLSQKVKHWADVMKLYPSELKFREQRTRWGSCSSRKAINLNWRLIVFSEEIIDYVIVHELSHLKHMDHSPKFWAVVETYIPEYSRIMKTLKSAQNTTDFLSERS